MPLNGGRGYVILVGDICDLCIINTGAIEWRQGIRDISGGYM